MAWLQCEHPQKGLSRAVVLRKPITTLGRSSGNDIVLDDPQIGKNHASIIKTGKNYQLNVSDNRSSLRVNGKPVQAKQLSAGDILQIGPWKITYSQGVPTETPTLSSALPLASLTRLVQLSADMMRDTDPHRLFTTLLKGLVELTGAEKGFIVVLRDGSRQLAASHNVDDQSLDLTALSDSIIRQVIKHLKPVIVSDALQDSRFGKSKSVVDLRLSSVLCVPMIHRNDLLGVIYLGNDQVTGLFTQADLALLQIYAAQGSVIVHSALLLNQLRTDNTWLRDQLKKADQGQIVGSSPAIKEVFRIIRRAAPTDLSVLILGETGTGKELFAREIHRKSPRHNQPFVAINCGAIPENLLESELFGHKKGAFTGAVADKMGKVEASSGGTLFLDEIGEMPPQLQVKLLRVLQERVIERIGDLGARPVDIRVIAATNTDLEALIQEGLFREDLFYRLNELSVSLPPLRDRGEDISVLAHYFLGKYRDQYGTKTRGLTNQALLAIKSYSWPGNVRELENRLKKAVIMSDRALLSPDDLGIHGNDKRHIRTLAEAEESFKIDYIRQVLELNNHNKAQTARDLGVDARTIFRYLEKAQ